MGLYSYHIRVAVALVISNKLKQVHRRKLKYKWLIPRVGNSIFRSVIFSIFKKINRDPTYIVDLWKRLTVLESLTSIFEKDQFDLCQHRIDLSITKNEQFNKKKHIFCMFLTVSSNLFMPKDWKAPFDLLSSIFSKGINLLSSIFEKDLPWSI